MPRWKACGNPVCKIKVRELHAFCKGCIRELPGAIRGRFFRAAKIGGQEYVEAKRVAVEFFAKKAQEPERMSKEIVEVTAESRGSSPSGLASAFFQGEFREDPRTGENREIWFWLPKSHIEVEEHKDGTCTIRMPEWLAMQEDLI